MIDQLIGKLNLVLPAAFIIAGGFLFGTVLERVIFAKLRKIVKIPAGRVDKSSSVASMAW